jgi:hypothetical protein
MDDLLDASVTFAQEMLGKRGEFYPFGAVVLDDGTVAMSAADPGLGDYPDSVSVIDALGKAFRRQASGSEIRTSAICCDVRIEDDGSGMTDAIRTTIEHRDADPVHVLLPYRLDDRGPEYGDLRAARADRTIFAA